MVSPIDQLSRSAMMQQADKHHHETMRAYSLHAAVMVMASSDNPEVTEILAESAAQGCTGTKQLELLANHFLTFIETGEFLT